MWPWLDSYLIQHLNTPFPTISNSEGIKGRFFSDFFFEGGGGCKWKVESLTACQKFLKIPFQLLISFHEVPLLLQLPESSRMKKTTVSSCHGTLLTPEVLVSPQQWPVVQLSGHWPSSLPFTPDTDCLHSVQLSHQGCLKTGVSARQQWAMAWNDILIPCPGIEPE